MYEERTGAARAPGIATVSIDSRFQGPDGIANGGYLAGRFGGPGPARVVFRNPARLDTPLQAIRTHFGLTLVDGESPVMSVESCEPPQSAEWAASATEIDNLPTPDLTAHPFPRCFVCGPDNEQGLRIVFRRTANGVASNFALRAAHATGTPLHVGIAGALDCSSGWAVYSPGEAGVLGTFEYVVHGEPEPGEQLTVVAERRGRSGRKRIAESCVLDASGALVGSALATWIDIPYSRRYLLAGNAPSVDVHTS